MSCEQPSTFPHFLRKTALDPSANPKEKGEGKFDSNSLNEDFAAKCFESLIEKAFDNFCCQLRKGLCCKVLQKSTVNAEVKVWVIKLSSLGMRSSSLLSSLRNTAL